MGNDPWEEARERDLLGSLQEVEREIPEAELASYHQGISQLGFPVRWNPELEIFEISHH